MLRKNWRIFFSLALIFGLSVFTIQAQGPGGYLATGGYVMAGGGSLFLDSTAQTGLQKCLACAAPGGITVQFLGRFKIQDQGTCTMASGTCPSQFLQSGYANPPNCIATWNGTGTLTGILKVPSTSGIATPSSTVGTDTAVVNWACFGN